MFTEHSALENVMVDAEVRGMAFIQEDIKGHPRWQDCSAQAVVDFPTGKDTEPRFLKAMSEKYTLINNRELVSAFDLALEGAGINAEPIRSRYHKGKSWMEFNLTDHEFKVPGDKSPIVPSIHIQNNYRGGGSVYFDGGLYRFVCKNGMKIGQTIIEVRRRHVGDVASEIMAMCNHVVMQMEQTIVVQELTAELAQKREMTSKEIEESIDRVLANIADRHEEKVKSAIQSNMNELGHNAWGFIQGISEVQTHELGGIAHIEWRDSQIDSLLGSLGVKADVAMAMR
jgi:hypothetical protein